MRQKMRHRPQIRVTNSSLKKHEHREYLFLLAFLFPARGSRFNEKV